MITIDVTEAGEGALVELTVANAALLEASNIVSVAPSTDGRWLVSGIGKVGVARIGEMTVRISPKLPIGRIFFLLGYGTKFKWRDDLVPYDSAADLVHVLADAFTRQADRALARGVIQGYVEREDELAVVRGRLRHREQVTRRFGQVTPVLVRYDDFTIDIAENQLVRAAARILRTVPGLDPMVASRLRAVLQRLDDVSDLNPGAPLPVWRPSRRNAHYETVLWFASMVLRRRSVDLPDGGVAVNGFVVNMAHVFEDFLTVALSDSLERIDGRVRSQDPHLLDEAGSVGMNPDLVWYRGGKPAAVIDAKYKVEKLTGYPNADLYQIIAYATALGLPVGHLVYAKGNSDERISVVRGSGVELRTHALDLELMPEQLLAQVDELAHLIAGAARS